jgi:hypothetical protein
MNPEEITAQEKALSSLYEEIQAQRQEFPQYIKSLFAEHMKRLGNKKASKEEQRRPQPKVRLSAWGKEMQGSHKKTGIIINKSLAGIYDYSVEVLWDGAKKAIWMHESQVEPVTSKKEEPKP